ncbi:MAG: hypothetical protein ACOY4Q_03835 [Bacillota bacterium]
MEDKKKKDKDREKTTGPKSKPYTTTYSEIYVEPVGMGPVKDK